MEKTLYRKVFTYLKKTILTLVLASCFLPALAQHVRIYGPTSVEQNSTHFYSVHFLESVDYSNWYTSGQLLSSWGSGALIKWPSAGTKYIFYGASGYWNYYMGYIDVEVRAPTPSYYLDTSTGSLGYAHTGGAKTFTFSTNTASQYVTGNRWWISTSRSGKTVTVKVRANSSTSGRSGSVTVSGGGLSRPVSITQAGAPPPAPCRVLGLWPLNGSIPAGGGTAGFRVELDGPNCSPSVTGSPSWAMATLYRLGPFYELEVYAAANTGTARSGTVSVRVGTTTRRVTVSQGAGVTVPVPTPSSPTVTNYCGYTKLTRGTPPSGETWYWQSSSTGKSTSNSSTNIDRTSSGTYYLRSRRSSDGVWSSARSVSYTVEQTPATPSPPNIDNQCGATVIARSIPPNGVTWYWQASSSGTSTSNSAATITKTSGKVVYLRAKSNSANCWGSARKINYTVEQGPSPPATPTVTEYCGFTRLTRGTPPSGVTWYWQSSSTGTSTSNSSTSIDRTSSGTYYLRAKNNSANCWSSARTINYTVEQGPSPPPVPLAYNYCGYTRLSFNGTAPSGVTWYWQSSSTGTSTSNSSTSIDRTSSGTYYLRARNNTTYCWGNASSVSYSVNQAPSPPPVPLAYNYCGYTKLSFNGSAPSGVTWYWQSGPSGTSTSNPSGSVNRYSGSVYYLRARNNSTGCWSSARSVNYNLTPNLSAGTIGSGQAIRKGEPFTPLKFTTLPSGGNGSYEYGWLSSTDGKTYTNTGASTSGYLASPIASTYYKVEVGSGGCVAETNTVFIRVTGPVLAGSVCCSDTIAKGEVPPELTSEEDASDGLKPYTYQWEVMDDTLVGWLPIDNTNSATYRPGILEKSTWFRRGVTDGLGQQAHTDSILIYVPTGTIIAQPVSLGKGGNTLTVHKGGYGENGEWEWYDTFKGPPFHASKDSTYTPSVTKPTRFRARAKYMLEGPEGGPGIEKYGYFVSTAVKPATKEQLNLPTNKNYILSYSPVKEVSTETALTSLPLEEQGATVQYFDGLGRPEQVIAVNQSYYFNDLVTGVAYDNYGRKVKDYIPSTVHGRGAYVSNVGANIDNFYSGVNGSPVDGLEYHGGTTNRDHTYTHYEASPLNRVEYVKGPKGGQTHYGYGTNAGGNVKIWTVEGDTLKNNNGSHYAAGGLYRTKTTDASGKVTEEYKDKLGQVILKVAGNGTTTAKTYYVYDDFGLLRYVLSPMATGAMTGTSYSRASAEVKGLCYYYEYDRRKRMVKKQLPGAEEVLMVYDARDRLVLTQDGKTRQENGNKWLYTLYDGLNRPIQTGWLTAGQTDHDLIQGDFSTVSDLDEIADLPSGYSALTTDILTKTHYDNYTDCPAPAPASGYMLTPKGQVTWNETKVLGTSSFVVTASYYDDKYRVIQQSIDGPDIDLTTTNTYDFVGNLTQSIESYSGQVNATITKDFTYDHAGRLEKVEQEIEGDGDNGKVVLAENHYNELGQLMLKKLHSANDTSFVQDIDYLYDVRGWLTKINNFEDTTANKLFAQELGYYQNGNISTMNWKNTMLNEEGHVLPGINRKYGFTYDGLNRLSNALYEHTEDGTGTIVQDLFTTAYSYDLNGNVTGLKRWGNTAMDGGPVVAGLIDDMVYTYFDNSNQIKSVADNTTSFVGHNLHFTEGPGDFAYDANGSSTYLPHKAASVGYNYLALPESIDITGEGVIGYTYSATGVKLVKSFGAAKTYYQGNAENMAGTEVLYHPEGRAVKTAGGWAYEYNLTDHLGNTRASFAIDTVHPVILQQKNYYPFGLEQATWNDMDANATRRLFGGKELQDEGELMTYDFGWRQLDVETNRWYVPDPMANLYYGWSPYNYALNNPISNYDPNGMWVETDKGWTTDDPEEIADWWEKNVGSSSKSDSNDNDDEANKDDKSNPVKEAFLSFFFKNTSIDAPDYIKENLPFKGEKSPREVRGPDLFGFYIGGKFFFVQGGGLESGLVWVKDDKGGMFITAKGGAGFDVSAGGGIMLGWYQGSGKPTLQSFSGGAFYIDKSGKVIDLGASVDYNPTLKQVGRQWKTLSVGVSTGIFKPLPSKASGGVSGTAVIPLN